MSPPYTVKIALVSEKNRLPSCPVLAVAGGAGTFLPNGPGIRPGGQAKAGRIMTLGAGLA